MALLVCLPQALQQMVRAILPRRLCPGLPQPVSTWLQDLCHTGIRQSHTITHTITITITITITMSTRGMLP